MFIDVKCTPFIEEVHQKSHTQGFLYKFIENLRNPKLLKSSLHLSPGVLSS